MISALTSLIRSELLHVEGVRRLPPARRFASLLTSETASECLYFLDSGYIKLTRRGRTSKEVILSLVGPGEIFAEHALLQQAPRPFTAEIMEEGSIYEIPRDVFLTLAKRRPEVWHMLWEIALRRQLESEQKIALLCLEEVEYRLLHYLQRLATQFSAPVTDQEEYLVMLSQRELASLVGATRETTSMLLNSFARQGLVRLDRRQVTVKSLDAIRGALRNYGGAKAAAQGSA